VAFLEPYRWYCMDAASADKMFNHLILYLSDFAQDKEKAKKYLENNKSLRILFLRKLPHIYLNGSLVI